jgi:branched-chain amino acid transport system substrate-binding protein
MRSELGFMTRFLAAGVILLLAASLGRVTAQERAVIKIGISTRLTGSSALIGDGDRKSTIMAVEEINAGGGIAGRLVEAVLADNKGVPSEAVNVARKLAEVDKVVLMLDSAGSSGTLAIMPILPQLGVVNLAKTSTNPKIFYASGVGGNPWAFRMNIDDDMIAETFAQFVAQRVHSISILAYNDDFGRGATEAYSKRLPAMGVRILSTDLFAPGTPDYRPLLSRVKQRNPESILLISNAGDTMVFVRQFHELGLTQKVFARGDLGSPEFLASIKDAPNLADGWIEASFWSQGLDPTYENRYQARWNTPPGFHGTMGYYAIKYVLPAVVHQAIKDTGQVTREGVRDALHKISAQTPIGRVTFDNHNQAYTNLFLIEVRGGKALILRTLKVSPPHQ